MGFLSSYSNAVGGFYKNMFNPSDYLSKSDIGYYVPILNQGKIAQENLNYQQNALEYNKSLQQQMFNREDNSVFRRAQDLKNAGMSPVLAAGQGASAGSPIAINPPQRSSYPDIVTMAYNLMKMDADISQTLTQQKLTQAQISEAGARASIAWHDAKVLEGSPGMLSTSSGIAKDIRELLGLFGMTPQGVKNSTPGWFKGSLDSLTKKFKNIQSPLSDEERKKQDEVMKEGFKNIEDFIKNPLGGKK